MKVSKTFSLDLEVVEEMSKRKLGSVWLNKVLRKVLGLSESEEERIDDLFSAEPITDLVKEKEEKVKVIWRDEDGKARETKR